MKYKWSYPVILIIVLVSTMSFVKPICSSTQINMEIIREIDIRVNYAIIRDQISILRGHIDNITYYMPLIYIQKIYKIEAYTQDGVKLETRIIKAYNFTYKLVVKLPSYETPFKLTLKICFIKIVTPTGPMAVKTVLPLYPSLPLNVSKCNVQVKLPRKIVSLTYISPNATVEEINGRKIIKYEASPLIAMNNESLILAYSTSMQQIHISSLIREVMPNNKVLVSEEIIVENEGVGDILSKLGFQLLLPLDAEVASVEDDFGKIEYSISYENESCILTIKPRINIKRGWKYRVYIKYGLSKEKWRIGEGKIIAPLDPFYDYPIDYFKVIMKVSEGGKILSIEGEKPKYVEERRVIYEFYNFTKGFYQPQAKIEYKAPPSKFEIPSYIINYIIIGTIIGVAIYVSRIIKKKMAIPIKVEEVIATIMPTLKEIQEIYMEKIEIMTEMIKLEESLRKRKVTRKIYKVRAKNLRSELSRINSKLSKLKEEIMKEAKFRKILSDIEKEEKEFESIIKSLIELEKEYIARRITRKVYESKKREQEKTLRKVRVRLERRIAELLEVI